MMRFRFAQITPVRFYIVVKVNDKNRKIELWEGILAVFYKK